MNQTNIPDNSPERASNRTADLTTKNPAPRGRVTGVVVRDAARAAASGALEAIEETHGDFERAVKASIGGVVSGVSAVDGDVTSATRRTARLVVAHASDPDRPDIGMVDVAEGAVDAILEEASRIPRVDEEAVVEAAAVGIVEAAYRLGQENGDAARRSVISRIVSPGIHIAPDIRDRLPEIAERLSQELPRGRAAWRGRALFEAARLLMRSGGIDLAASLAFFATLSILPMVALLIMAIAVLGDSDEIQSNLTETLIYYFPTSRELIRQAVQNILNASVAIGLVSATSLAIGAGGMFASANRTVKRAADTGYGGHVQLRLSPRGPDQDGGRPAPEPARRNSRQTRATGFGRSLNQADSRARYTQEQQEAEHVRDSRDYDRGRHRRVNAHPPQQ